MARPLTKQKRNGVLYTRPAHINVSIDQAIQQDLDTLVRRAAIRDKSGSGFLPSECLVHLIREARRRGDQSAMSGLLPELLIRCEAILRQKVPDDWLPNAEEVREEVLGNFGILFAEDGSDGINELDFFECRFNLAFRTFRFPYIERGQAEIEGRVFQPAEGESMSEVTEDEFLSQLSEKTRGSAPCVDSVLRNELLKAIGALPPDQGKAVMLVYYYDLPVESEDPSVQSAASQCGVTGRTIRNRLQRAITTLSKTFKKGRGETS